MLTIFEVVMLLKNIPKEQLATSIRRTCDAVLNRNGFFRDIKYLGLQNTPYRHSKDKTPVKEAHYLYYEFNVAPRTIPDILNEWKLDRDVVKKTLFPLDSEKIHPIIFDQCTFEDEMKPVPYRPEVVKLVKRAKAFTRHKKPPKDLHLEMPYFPFQR